MSARYIAHGQSLAARRLGDEMVVMSTRTSVLFSLNEAAALIWEAADGVTPLAEIVHLSVCAVFDVEADVALRDAESLVDELIGHGILIVSDQPIRQEHGARR